MERTEAKTSRRSGMQHARNCVVCGFACSVFLAGGHQAVAGVWDVSPNIMLSEIYLDNEGQALADQAGTDYVTEVSPSIKVRREGQRATLDLFYRMQNLWYYEDDDLNNTYHQYSANAGAELVRNMVFLEGGATRTQQILDPNNVVTFDNLTTKANRSDVDTYSIRPSFQYQFGSVARAGASVSYDRVSYSGSSAGDTDTIGYSAALASNENSANRFSWAGSFRRTEYVRDSSTEEDEYSQLMLLDVGYQVEKRLTAIAGVGYEDSDIEQTTTGQSGRSWKVGAKWEPSLRTSVTGTIGERFYGKTAFLEVRHQRKRSRWLLSYTENVTQVSQLVLGGDLFSQTISTDQDTALVSTGEPEAKTIINTPEVTTGLYLAKRWNGSVTTTTFRSQLDLRGYHEDRELTVGGDSDIIFGGSAGWSYALGNHTTSTISGDWQRQKLVDTGKQNDDIWTASVELSHELGVNTVASVSARRVERDSPSSELSYQQNQVSATLFISL